MRGGCLCNVLIIKRINAVGSCIFPLITCSSRNYNKKYIIFAVTAAIAKVSTEDLAGKSPVRVDNALKGLAAGVNVTSSSGQPGASPKVRIRGTGTINNSDPLYIVDGMPIEGGSNVLPMRWDDKNCGRMSQAMCYMMYAEMVMYQNDKTRYPKALQYMKEIIGDKGNYDLVDDFASIWKESGEWCKESIWEVNYEDGNNERGWDSPLAIGGTVLPTLISPNSWPGGDGWNQGGDGWGFLPVRQETYDMYGTGDKRRDATIWDVRGVEYTERYQDTHLWLAKYRPFTENNADAGFDNNLNYNNNLRVYRVAEAYLNAAELLLETGGDAGLAKEYVNKIRRRAGIAELGAVTLDDVINERRLEFVGEGKRYFDLVRTGKAATVLVPDNYGYRTQSWTPDKKYIPIAQAELDSDPALKQNEDYFK